MLRSTKKVIVRRKLCVTLDYEYEECKFQALDCPNGQVESVYIKNGKKGQKVFCLGVPDMDKTGLYECCPERRREICVDGEYIIYRTEKAAKRMATLYEKMGKNVIRTE